MGSNLLVILLSENNSQQDSLLIRTCQMWLFVTGLKWSSGHLTSNWVPQISLSLSSLRPSLPSPDQPNIPLQSRNWIWCNWLPTPQYWNVYQARVIWTRLKIKLSIWSVWARQDCTKFDQIQFEVIRREHGRRRRRGRRRGRSRGRSRH